MDKLMGKLNYFVLGVAATLLALYAIPDAICLYKSNVTFCSLSKNINPSLARDRFEWGMK